MFDSNTDANLPDLFSGDQGFLFKLQQPSMDSPDYINDIMSHWTLSPEAKAAIDHATTASNNAGAASGMQGSGQQLQEVQGINQAVTSHDQMNYLNHILQLNEMRNKGRVGYSSFSQDQDEFNKQMQAQQKQGIANAIGSGVGLAAGAYQNYGGSGSGGQSYYPPPPSFGGG
jgi:hypothetical protein